MEPALSAIKERRHQILLPAKCLHNNIIEEMEEKGILPQIVLVAPMEFNPVPHILVDNILRANREAESVEEDRDNACNNKVDDWTIERGLTLYKGQLLVPFDDNLQTQVIEEAHSQVSTAHPST